MTEENKLITERKKKLDEIKKKYKPYPNSFKKSHSTDVVISKYSNYEKESLAEDAVNVSVSGRLLTIRNMGN